MSSSRRSSLERRGRGDVRTQGLTVLDHFGNLTARHERLTPRSSPATPGRPVPSGTVTKAAGQRRSTFTGLRSTLAATGYQPEATGLAAPAGESTASPITSTRLASSSTRRIPPGRPPEARSARKLVVSVEDAFGNTRHHRRRLDDRRVGRDPDRRGPAAGHGHQGRRRRRRDVHEPPDRHLRRQDPERARHARRPDAGHRRLRQLHGLVWRRRQLVYSTQPTCATARLHLRHAAGRHCRGRVRQTVTSGPRLDDRHHDVDLQRRRNTPGHDHRRCRRRHRHLHQPPHRHTGAHTLAASGTFSALARSASTPRASLSRRRRRPARSDATHRRDRRLSLGTQPVVTVEDANGNVVTTGTDSTIDVTIGSKTGAGTLQGTATKTAVAGVATFTNLRIDTSGATPSAPPAPSPAPARSASTPPASPSPPRTGQPARLHRSLAARPPGRRSGRSRSSRSRTPTATSSPPAPTPPSTSPPRSRPAAARCRARPPRPRSPASPPSPTSASTQAAPTPCARAAPRRPRPVSVTPKSFTVSSASATALVFTTQPSGATAGSASGPSPSSRSKTRSGTRSPPAPTRRSTSR